MRCRREVPNLHGLCHAIGGVAFLMMLGGFSACTTDFSDEKMQPLAATASDLGRAVRHYAKTNSEEIQTISDQELVQRATAYDPSLMEPYEGFIVRGLPEGVILVCTEDGKRGLIEDAVCSVEVDSKRWHDRSSPCEFQVDLAIACGN